MLETNQVEKAVDAIQTLLKGKAGAVNLVDQPRKIDVQFTLKRIPNLKQKKIPIKLPTSLHTEQQEICLFVRDLDKKSREYEVTVQHYEDLLSKHGVKTISKIVPLKALRTDYSLPSNKVSLAKAYDLYLAEDCVMGLMPALLGKVFYSKKKRVPVQVNLRAKDLKKEINRVVNNTRCVIQGTGSSCLVTVAHDQMDKDQIVDNVVATCEQLQKLIPGGLKNIRNMYIKSADTTALPLYIDLGSVNDVDLPKVNQTKLATYIDEVTTVTDGLVKITADGKVQIISGDRKRKQNKPKKTKKKEKRNKDDEKSELEVEIKEEITVDTDNQGENGVVKIDDDSEVDEDDDDKEDVKAEIEKSQKSGKRGKGKKKSKKDSSKETGKAEKVQTFGDEIDDKNEIVASVDDSNDVQVKINKKKKDKPVDKKQKKRKSEVNVHVEASEDPSPEKKANNSNVDNSNTVRKDRKSGESSIKTLSRKCKKPRSR